MTNTPLSETLKERTLPNHQLLEKTLVAQMRSINSVTAYIALLRLFYSYFGAVEDQIAAFINTAQLPDYAQRRKTESLFTDIEALGGTVNAKADKAFLPEISNALQAFGALYVIEGSTLGGSIIGKMMARQLNITDGAGLSFFGGYGGDTGTMWLAFKQALDRLAINNAEEGLVINAANGTFAGFKQWIDAHA